MNWRALRFFAAGFGILYGAFTILCVGLALYAHEPWWQPVAVFSSVWGASTLAAFGLNEITERL